MKPSVSGKIWVGQHRPAKLPARMELAVQDSSYKLQMAHATQELHVNLNFIYI